MSKWVEIRDAALKNLEVGKVTEEMKEDFTKWLVETLLPVLEVGADKFVGQIIEQAKDETGWCKLRDLIVLPGIIRGGLWLIKNTLAKTAANTVK